MKKKVKIRGPKIEEAALWRKRGPTRYLGHQ